MPYEIETKDGIVVRGIPDDIPADHPSVKRKVAAARGDAAQTGRPTATGLESAAAFPVTRLLTGAASPLLSAAEHLPGSAGQFMRESNQTLKDMVDRGKAAQPDQLRYAGNIYDVAGSLLNPAALKAGKMLPYLRGASTIPGKISQIAGNVGIGGGAAGLFSLMQPGGNVENPIENKIDRAASAVPYGMAGAAAIPAISGLARGGEAIYRGGKRLVDAHLEGGIDRAAARVAGKAADAGGGRDAVIKELLLAESATVGAPMTAGQAAAGARNTAFSGLQKAVEPFASKKYLDVEDAAKAARSGEIRSFAGTEDDVAALVKGRSEAAANDYGEAYRKAISPDSFIGKLSKSPSFQAAQKDANDLAADMVASTGNKPGLTEYLHFVKVSLDKQLTKTGDNALGNTQKQSVTGIKNALVGWMNTKNPAYNTARENFAAASKPINTMRVGQELEGRLINPSGKETAGAFLNALNDSAKTIKNATGNPRFTKLEDVIGAENAQKAQSVASDLERNLAYQELAKRGGKEGQKIIDQAIPTAPPTGVFAPIISATRSWINTAKGDATEEMVKVLAERMAGNPAEFGKFMKSVPQENRASVYQFMLKTMKARPYAAGAIGSESQR